MSEGDGDELRFVLAPEAEGLRLDRALAMSAPNLSRARIQALIAVGAIEVDGVAALDASAKARTGAEVLIDLPPPVEALPRPQDLALGVLFEDAHLIVVDKPAGMAAHPAPGTRDGTLVNALLHRCGSSLSGIGGVARPGIVHRLDKDTSGIMVAAKTDAAHRGLSALFASHDIDRAYIAITRGAPAPASGTIEGRLGRSPADRKKMAVLRLGGRWAVTHYAVERTFGPASATLTSGKEAAKPLAARVRCTLETGRTHQIRVHLASMGAPCLGDATYGSGLPAAATREAVERAGLTRQALHAAVLGFIHPVTGQVLRFESPLPPDLAALESELATQLF